MQSRILSGGNLITDSKIYGGVNYTQDINPDSNLQYGIVSIPEVEFTIDYNNRNLLSSGSFVWALQSMEDADTRRIGTFIIDSITKEKNKAKVKAYGRGILLDASADAWLESITFPITLGNLYSSLCQYFHLNYYPLPFHQNFVINDKNFTGTNISGRDMMQYIASAAFCNFVPKIVGSTEYDIYPIRYLTTDTVKKAFDNHSYVTAVVDLVAAPQITGVQIQSTNSDIGYVAGTPNYVVTENPIFYTADNTTQQAIQDIANTEKNVLGALNYTPFTLETLDDYHVNVGDRITIDGTSSFVMSKKISSKGFEFAAVSETTRNISTDDQNRQITILKNQTNELINTVSEHTRTLTTQGESISTISQKSDSITQTIEGKVTYYNQSSQPSNPHTGDIWQNGSTYRKWDGAHWISITEDEAGNLWTINSIYHTLDGVVYDNGSGTTVINRSNILTRTIAASRIDLEGNVEWGDLSDDCKSEIASHATDYDDDDVKALLNQTYNISHTSLTGTQIQSPRIMSPEIYGSEIYAGTSDDGYCAMDSTGLNIYTTSGEKAVIGLGYLTNKYDYPFIILGRGVDESGTDKGMIKKFSSRIWIGDNDAEGSTSVSGTGLFVDFNGNNIYKYINGNASLIGEAVFG